MTMIRPIIQWDETERFLKLLGRSAESTDALLFPPKDGPGSDKKTAFKLKLHEAGRQEAERLLAMPLYRFHSFGLRPNPGGAKAAEITEGVAVFCEADGGLSIEAQEAIPGLIGLPPPTFTVWTGGKSLHLYWCCEKGQELPPHQWKEAQKRLIAAVKEVVPNAGVDEAIKDPSRVMRAPGGMHPSTGERCRIHSESGVRYDLAALMELLPPLPAKTPKTKKAASAASADSGFPPPTKEEIHAALQCVPPRPGGGTGTYPLYRNLLWSLIAVLREVSTANPVEEGIALMEAHSPSHECGWDVQQVACSGGDEVNAGTFWYLARQHGFLGECSKLSSKDSEMKYQISKASEVCADVGKINWTIEGFAATGLVLVAAETGTGKTTLFYRAADAVQEGTLFLDQVPVRTGRVLVVQGDEPKSVAFRKINRMGLKKNFDLLFADSTLDLDFLIDLIRKTDYQVIIIDSLTTVLASSDCTTLDQSMVDKLYTINRIASDQGVLILMTAHLNKPAKDGNGNRKARKHITWADISGLSTIGAAVNDCWGLTRSGNSFSLHCLGKRFVEAGIEWVLDRDPEDYWWGLQKVSDGLMPLEAVDAKQRIIQLLDKDQVLLTASDTAKKLGINEEHARRCLFDLYDEGKVERHAKHLPGRGRPSHCYGIK
jgi:hypothetical protein